MSTIRLVPYLIWLRWSGEPGNPDFNLSNVNQVTIKQNKVSFIEIVSDILSIHSGDDENTYENGNKTLFVEDFEVSEDGRTIEALLKSGKSGKKQSHFNQDTKERDPEGKGVEDAAEDPVYVIIHVPNGGERALCIIQRSGIWGYKGVFEDLLSSQVKDYFNGEVLMEMDRAVTSSALEYVLNEADCLREIEFSGYIGGSSEDRISKKNAEKSGHKHRSIFESIGLSNNAGDDVTASLKLSADAEGDLRASDNFIRVIQDSKYSNEWETGKGIVEYDKGFQQTVPLIDKPFRMEWKFDEEQFKKRGGHPLPEELGETCRKFINTEFGDKIGVPLDEESLLS